MRALVSIVIPIYNGENYLREAIESVLAQTYANYELIVVDDGSTDRTPSIAQSYGSRLTYVYQQNGGAASAFNHGLRRAQGKYIAWLSHDDIYLPQKLERQVELLEAQPQIGACFTYYYQINAAGDTIREMRSAWYPREQMLRELMRHIFLNFGTVMLRQSCIEEVGYLDERMGYAQDAQMLIRLQRRFEMALIPEFLLKARVHPAAGSAVHAQEVRQHAQQMYRDCLRDLTLVELFPEFDGKSLNGKDVAQARCWLGNAMCYDRQYHFLALQQYLLGLKAWRAVHNPAFKRLPALMYLASRRWLGSQVRKLRARSSI
jgi:glycosyltransferase involved in cell wall biosynthesis